MDEYHNITNYYYQNLYRKLAAIFGYASDNNFDINYKIGIWYLIVDDFLNSSKTNLKKDLES